MRLPDVDWYQSILIKKQKLIKYQSVENAGVAFVKGANERNEFFEKKKNK